MRTAKEAPSVFPCFRYRDAPKMIDWLGDAFGFSVRAKYMDGDKVAHAELTLGSSIVMAGSVKDDDYGRIVGGPGRDNAGKSVYIAVPDADAVYATAKAAGARIVDELTNRDYGSREFICTDPEGHVWAFGTYWPKADEPAM
ncbi:VOC family protein [Arvimicrobium flavum]|uniref:VOC family protein n=1 Tax=Arvimicrobium flavum TaxID=3393320 RepID=UPI00237B9E8F|nr:VOC family protein [Mesorhizobium shangrilense]